MGASEDGEYEHTDYVHYNFYSYALFPHSVYPTYLLHIWSKLESSNWYLKFTDGKHLEKVLENTVEKSNCS